MFCLLKQLFRAEIEAKKTNEKDEEIRSVEAEILKIKSDIYNLKDVFNKYSMYGKFLATISPEDWKNEMVCFQNILIWFKFSIFRHSKKRKAKLQIQKFW